MSRVQLALNVSDLDAAVDFYTKLFATEPAKRRPGYANFALAQPPLKLVLIENPGTGALEGVDPRGRGRGDTGQVAGEVECCALRGEQPPGRARDPHRLHREPQ